MNGKAITGKTEILYLLLSHFSTTFLLRQIITLGLEFSKLQMHEPEIFTLDAKLLRIL